VLVIADTLRNIHAVETLLFKTSGSEQVAHHNDLKKLLLILPILYVLSHHVCVPGTLI